MASTELEGGNPPIDSEQRLRERILQQAAVADLGQFALSGAHITAIMDRAVALLAKTLGVEYAKVLELLPEGEHLLLRAGVGWHPGLLGCATVDTGLNSQAGFTLASNGPVIVEDLPSETRFSGPPLLHDHGVISGMSTIISGRDGPYGVLGVHTTRRHTFTDDDIHFLQAIANLIGMSVERVRGERDLALYREIFANSNDGIAIIGLDGRYVEQNRAHEQLLGYTARELRDQTPALHMGDENMAQVVASLIATGSFQGEVTSKAKDGRTLDIDLSAFTVADNAGQPVFHVGIKRDITSRKREAEAVAQSEARYRTLLETAPLAIAVHQEQKLVYANPAAARLVGADSPDAIIGHPVFDFVHPDYRDSLLRETREARSAGVPTPPREAKLLTMDGQILDVELTSIPLSAGETAATQVLVRDVTSQKRAENHLRFLVEAGDLLAGSLDYETTLRRVAEVATRRLADWAAVDMVDQDDRIQRLAVAHSDPAKVELVQELMRRYPPDDTHVARQVIQTGEPFWMPEISEEFLQQIARDAEHLRLLRTLGLRSAMVVPLRVYGTVVGALTFVNTESGRPFTAEDYDIAQQISQRCAIAIDNARLYQQAEDLRRLAEANEQRLEFILRAAQVGTWEWDLSSGRVVWSETLEGIHGLPPGSFGGTVDDFKRDVHPHDLSRVMETIDQALRDGNEYEVQYRIVPPGDEDVRWLHARGVVLRDTEQRPFGMTGVCTDITKRVQAQEALRLEQERLATLVEVSPIGVTIWRPDTDEILLANPEAGRIQRAAIAPGSRMQQLLEGLRFQTESGADIPVESLPPLRAALAKERVRAERLDVVFPDGVVQPVLMNASPLLDENGEVGAVVILSQDITSLTENERLRNEFLGMVTHELRSPLVVIKSATAMAKEELLASLESTDLLEAIDQQADRMLGLVANLLDSAQMEAGAFSIEPRKADLAAVLQDTVRNYAPANNVAVEVNVAPLPLLSLDEQRISQVIINLLVNAARYADPDSKVTVSAEPDGASVLVSVHNHGAPIPPDKAPLLFRRFSSLADGKAAAGAGLGLSICKGIIEAHRGTIWAESSTASRDTTFYFRLPLDSDDSSGPSESSEGESDTRRPPTEGKPQTLHVLAVDDEPMVLRYVQSLLRRTGYQVSGVSNGRDAIDAVRESEPQLVLLDLMMPEISGFDVLEEIRSFSDVPVILLSASNRDEDKVQGLDLGADDYITKPFSTTELTARVRAVLRRRSDGTP